MISSSPDAGESHVPTSYERMEQALSEAASHPGQTMNGGTGQSSQSHQQTLPTSHQPVTASTCTALEHAVVSTPQTPSDLPIGSSKAQQDEEVNPDEHAFRGRSSVHRASRTDPSSNTTYASLRGSNSSPREKSEQKHSPLFSTTQELPVLPRHTYSNMDPLSSSSTHEVSKICPQVIHSDAESSRSSSPPSTSPMIMQGTTKSSSPKPGSMLRRGKWTLEEETYVARIIQDFNSGFLNAPAGTTLRSYLSEKLQCDPMRITKKFTGDSCIGKRVFHPAVRSTANAAAIDKAQAELDTLERRWRRRLEMQQRDSAKKAAASAAAANAATGGGRGQTMIQGVPVAFLSAGVGKCSTSDIAPEVGQSVVTQAASWLDRANAILRGAQIQGLPVSNAMGFHDQGESMDMMANSEIENQMKEVQRLIYEGPQIQMTTAGLPDLLATNQRPSSALESPPSPPEPVDKRMRTGGTITGAEDAEALVGFLRSVRASAAAGQDSS